MTVVETARPVAEAVPVATSSMWMMIWRGPGGTMALALPVLVLGLSGVLGSWLWSGLPTDWLPGGRWISANSGWCLMASAAALFIGRLPTRFRVVLVRVLGLLLLGDGLMVAMQMLAGLHPAATDSMTIAAFWVDGSGATSAIAWIGTGIYFLTLRRPRYRQLGLGAVLMVFAIGVASLIGWASGTFGEYFIDRETTVTALPTAIGLLLLAGGMVNLGLAAGGWQRFLRHHPDRRLSILGISLLFIMVLAAGMVGLYFASRSVVALHRATLMVEAQHLSESFRSLIRDGFQELYQLADAAEPVVAHAGTGGRRLRSSLEQLIDSWNGRPIGLHWQRSGRPPLALGLGLPEGGDFAMVWNEGGNGRLIWEDGLKLVLERPVDRTGNLTLVLDIDAAYQQMIAAYQSHRTNSIDLCTADGRSRTMALCLPNRHSTATWNQYLTRQGQPRPLARALSGQSGTTMAVDSRGLHVSSAYLPVVSGLGLVAQVDAAEALAPIRSQVWSVVLAIVLVTLTGGLLFWHLTHVQMRLLIHAQNSRRALVEHVPVAVIAVDDQGTILGLNASAEAMFGYPRQMAQGFPARHLFAGPMASADTVPTWQDSRRMLARRRDGSTFEAEITIGPYAAEGRRHSILLITDIDERLREQEVLIQWQAIFDHIGCGIAVSSSEDGLLELVNPCFARMHGYAVADLTGKPLAHLFASAMQDGLAVHVALAHSRGHHSFESIHVRRDGSEFPVQVDVSAVYNKTGAVLFRIVGVQDISERKRLEQEVRNVESIHRSILDSQRDLVCQWRPDYCLEYVNPAFAAFYGRQPRELQGKSWLDLLPPESRDEAASLMAQLLVHPRIISYDAPARRNGDDVAWLSWTHAPLWRPDGQLMGFHTRAHEVTAIKVAEQAAIDYRRRLSALFDSRLQPTCLLGADGTVIQPNRAMTDLSQASPDEIIGLPLWQSPGCRDLPETVRQLQAAVAAAASGKVSRLEVPIHLAGKGMATFEIVCAPVVDRHQGRIDLLIAEGRDVTEIRRTEQIAAERESRLQAMASSLPGMLFEFRLDRQRVQPIHVSEGVSELCGVSAGELMSGIKPLIDCVHTDDRQSFETSLNYAVKLASGWNWIGRLRNSHLDTVVWVSLRAKPRVTGRQIVWDGIALNITDLKEKELEIADSRQALRELSAHREAVREDERKYIAREIHDELGQNLTALRMGLAVLEAQRSLAADGGGSGDILRLKGLVDRSISVVRSIATSLRPAALDMGLSAALHWLADEFQNRSNVACTLDLGGAPDALDEDMATGLFRIVQESLTNVARHANATKVHVMLRQLGHHLVLEVRDDGGGFDAGIGSGRKGYGLMGIRERTVMLGGRINIISSPEQGTVISVTVPLNSP